MFDLSVTTMIIYKITNTINGKVYIGQSQHSFNKRYERNGVGAERVLACYEFAKERGDSYNKHLYHSMKKYGVENFTVEILEQCKTIAKLNSREKYYIKLYNSGDPDFGYNYQLGGGSSRYTTKMKKHRQQQKRQEEINNYSFLSEIFDDNILYTYVDEKVLYSLKQNARTIYILLSVLHDGNVICIDRKSLYNCLPKHENRKKMLIKILDELQDKEIIEYTDVDGDLIGFNVLKQGSKEIELLILYHIDLLASLKKYTKFLRKETILKKCQKCERYVCVLKTAANTKYCEECRKEVNREKTRKRVAEKRKNKHTQS